MPASRTSSSIPVGTPLSPREVAIIVPPWGNGGDGAWVEGSDARPRGEPDEGRTLSGTKAGEQPGHCQPTICHHQLSPTTVTNQTILLMTVRGIVAVQFVRLVVSQDTQSLPYRFSVQVLLQWPCASVFHF